jgi:hypothetical protein
VKYTETLFSGRSGWAEQLVYSATILERSNREFVHPNSVFKDQIANAVSWDIPDDSIRLRFDFPIQQRLLMDAPSPAHRIYAYNPTDAIEAGVDRELVAEYKGLPIAPSAIAAAELPTLEQRTAYLLYAWEIQQKIIEEWNFFADLQENLWIAILLGEDVFDQDFVELYYLDEPGRRIKIGIPTSTFDIPKPWINDISRSNYEALITEWLLDSGTTARSGGAAVSNDSYILWLAERLQDITTTWAQVAPQIDGLAHAPYFKNGAPYLGQVATLSIDPRYTHRFAPVTIPVLSVEGGAGPSGTSDSGSPDPAGGGSAGLDLLEELASREGGLNAELGSGANSSPINTLPEC